MTEFLYRPAVCLSLQASIGHFNLVRLMRPGREEREQNRQTSQAGMEIGPWSNGLAAAGTVDPKASTAVSADYTPGDICSEPKRRAISNLQVMNPVCRPPHGRHRRRQRRRLHPCGRLRLPPPRQDRSRTDRSKPRSFGPPSVSQRRAKISVTIAVRY